MSNNIHPLSPESPEKRNYAYLDAYRKEISILLSKPIIAELKRRNQSKMAFINELNNQGIRYSYQGFNEALKGTNNFVTNLNYFGKIYEYLNLPFPSLAYLSSFS